MKKPMILTYKYLSFFIKTKTSSTYRFYLIISPQPSSIHDIRCITLHAYTFSPLNSFTAFIIATIFSGEIPAIIL